MFSGLFNRLRALFHPETADAELGEELRFHFDKQVEKLVQSGLPMGEARRRARLLIGGSDAIEEECAAGPKWLSGWFLAQGENAC